MQRNGQAISLKTKQTAHKNRVYVFFKLKEEHVIKNNIYFTEVNCF